MAATQATTSQNDSVLTSIDAELDKRGFAQLGQLLTDSEIDSITSMYSHESRFRSHIIMQRHGFGKGEYKYFANPLPPIVARLRRELYSRVLPTANKWQDDLGADKQFPNTLNGMLKRCHADNQRRPTPLVLKYGPGDYNCLHQDLYGKHVFPLQVVILLSDVSDFEGGEFVMTEQRPRMQSKVSVVSLKKGHGVVFAVNERPRQGTRGVYRVKMRHGVSEIQSGERYTLGILFHDAA
jgi:hypothetical protein